MKKNIIAATIVAAALTIGAPAAAFAATYPGNSVTTIGVPGSIVQLSQLQTDQVVGTKAVVTISPVDPAIVAILPASTQGIVGNGGFLTTSVVIPKNAQPGQAFGVSIVAGNYKTVVPITIATKLVADVTPISAGFNAAPTIWFGAGLLLVLAAFAATTVYARRNRA